MRHAKLGDYKVPESNLSAEELQAAKDEFPDHINIVCFVGPEKKPKQFWEKEDEVPERLEPLAMAQDKPFIDYFGTTWGKAGKQNKSTAPKARIASLDES